MGTLYLVATPIGNLEDISPRGLRILSEVRLIAAEDTRHTRQLLTHFEIHTPLTSYYEHNKLKKLDTVLAALSLGDVALVSDAGTPAINDPGYELVLAALQANHCVSPIPGPSAPIAALSASGLPSESFLYLGYLPRKTAERKRLFEKIENHPYTLIFLESPHRLTGSLRDMQVFLGDRQVAVARELTKIHEEILRGTISRVLAHFAALEPRGEFVLVVEGKRGEESPLRWQPDEMLSQIRRLQAQGRSSSDISAELAEKSGWTRREIYRLILDGNQPGQS